MALDQGHAQLTVGQLVSRAGNDKVLMLRHQHLRRLMLRRRMLN